MRRLEMMFRQTLTKIAIVSWTMFFTVGVCHAVGPVYKYYQKGAFYASQERFDEAKEEFKNSVKTDPTPDPAEIAIRIIEDAAGKKIKQEAAIHIFESIDFRNKRTLEEAIEEADEAVAMDANYALAYNYRGLTYWEGGDLSQAISDYNKAIEIYPYYADAYINRGNVFSYKGNYDLAILNYNQALEIDPNVRNAYVNRGVAYNYKGDLDQAISDYNKAVEINHGNADAYYWLGGLYYRQGKLDLAAESFEKSVALGSTNFDNYFYLGNAYLRKGGYRKAIPPLKKALSIKPDSPIVLNDLAWAYSQLNINLEEAVVLAKEADRLEPNRKETLDTLAACSSKLSAHYLKHFKLIRAAKAFMLSLEYKKKLRKL